ncbi:hypothetical protein P4H94_02130 [Paenibacillus macerans]|uniref:hypothetical protein n=1 Tax=Paenibacillus TaxID=44249 RepID=UPI00097A9FEE|nr:hypothetical protein [Paenibacillus macerans]MBS5910342.1 hypothetical protein [Paenibacillus macerans]MEC0135698.1 hypothetical protein [Paenibacillus macerans]OMG49886.1 hypothetical protein BK140_08300 [Paenibacillus macerans]
MYKKRVPFLFIIALIIFLTGCSTSKSSVTSYIKILEKESSKNNYWIIAVNPYDSRSKEISILIKDKNTWNLLLLNKIYFATYESIYSNSTKFNLKEIDYPDE